MTSMPQELEQYGTEQFRMKRLQAYNWGTFSGLHDVAISERGFLFVGRSGSGKSTLLDAFSALLVPPKWVDFNAAAREADKRGHDRSLVTYVRGAWAEQPDGESGEVATQYLRKGTTWSALALSFCNGEGRYVVLTRLFWIRGQGTGSADLKYLFIIFDRPLDLRELDVFGQSDFDVRKLKQTFPEAFVRDDFRPYCERFMHLLGIENEPTLRLLHKTQSAKNLGDLNAFLREFMLEKPKTFDAADRLVQEFGELNAAHQAVVTAREQVEVLTPAHQKFDRMQELEQDRQSLKLQEAGATAYRESLRLDLLERELDRLQGTAEGQEGRCRQLSEIAEQQKNILVGLEQQHREAGGDKIEQWEREISQLGDRRNDRLKKYGLVEKACGELVWTIPKTPDEFALIHGEARKELDAWETNSEMAFARFAELSKQKDDAAKAALMVRKEIESLQRQQSNIDADMLGLRQEISNATGIPAEALPFAGELMDVLSEDAHWRGAIERLLRGFALSLLVEDRNYALFASHVNNTNLHRRLVYLRIGPVELESGRSLGSNSLVHKMLVKECRQSDWVKSELRRRYDYACVDTLQAFRQLDRAITLQGQIKHNRTSHEKDDRRDIGDRRRWVLGFNNQEKLALYRKQERDLTEELERHFYQLAEFAAESKKHDLRRANCLVLVNLDWHELDVQTLIQQMALLERQINNVRAASSTLNSIGGQIAEQRKLVAAADREHQAVKTEYEVSVHQIRSTERERDEVEEAITAPTFPALQEDVRRQLQERLSVICSELTLHNLDRMLTKVTAEIVSAIGEIGESIMDHKKDIEKHFSEFMRKWPAESTDMQANLASAPDFFAKLDRLRNDGLPAHEQRFFDLLRNQSHENLAELSERMRDARRDILERMEGVNESLKQLPFNQHQDCTTYLQIDASERQFVEVQEFKREMHETLSHAWSEDRDLAESRFLILRRMVEQLSNQDAQWRRWRDTVLDVRQHVEFIGRETDLDGNVVELYRSGSGKSGGERQKLATTCLAAALRYQLGGRDRTLPRYAAVILDEAFDKADSEFTALSMNIFVQFGFQMIVATPLKSVMTLEPFIGGACFVDIRDRNVSSVLLIEYDSEDQKLKLPERTVRAADEEDRVEVSG